MTVLRQGLLHCTRNSHIQTEWFYPGDLTEAAKFIHSMQNVIGILFFGSNLNNFLCKTPLVKSFMGLPAASDLSHMALDISDVHIQL